MQILTLFIQVAIFFGVWFILSGHTEPEFIASGLLTATLAIFMANWLIASKSRSFPSLVGLTMGTIKFILIYLPWLLWQILLSNLHVAKLILHPSLPVQPTIVQFEASLESEATQILLAQSITLTPGTVTIDASDGIFTVHCLSSTTRNGLVSADIHNKIAKIFGHPKVHEIQLIDITAEVGQA
tara:strand:+ start:125 stop:676 length:552 start_codon:yes stop_codon:yes gene_type:complete